MPGLTQSVKVDEKGRSYDERIPISLQDSAGGTVTSTLDDDDDEALETPVVEIADSTAEGEGEGDGEMEVEMEERSGAGFVAGTLGARANPFRSGGVRGREEAG